MFQTDQATAATALPTPSAAGTPGYFTNGNPSTGVAATILDADFMNMLMMELSNVVTGAGLTLSKTTYNQVLSAIKRIGQNTVVLADTGTVNAYTAVNAVPLVSGTWVDGVVQQVKIAHANTGASTYAPDGLTAIPIYGLGLQPLQGGELALNGTAVLMHATIAGVNSGNPIAVLMECAGGAQQIAPATQSQHAVQFGQVNPGRLLNIQTFTSSGTYTPTAGTTHVRVKVVGGGGGGGGAGATAAGQSSGGGGGSGGSYSEGYYVNSTSQTVTVGAGGVPSGASASAGGAGGTSSFGALISAAGGGGGIGGPAGVGPIISAGGGAQGALPTLGNIANTVGNEGGYAILMSSANSVGGAGGASTLGGGAPHSTSAAGNNGVSPGSGASGGSALASGAAVSGGRGAPGIVIVEEYA